MMTTFSVFLVSNNCTFIYLTITLPTKAAAKYCDEYVCVSVCLSATISPESHAQSSSIYLHVAYGRGSLLLRRRCDMLCYVLPVLWMTSRAI